MLFLKNKISKHYNMTTTPKQRLIILNLGITSNLNLGNSTATPANSAAIYNKNLLLGYRYTMNSDNVNSCQVYSLLENCNDKFEMFTPKVTSKNASYLMTTSLIKTSNIYLKSKK